MGKKKNSKTKTTKKLSAIGRKYIKPTNPGKKYSHQDVETIDREKKKVVAELSGKQKLKLARGRTPKLSAAYAARKTQAKAAAPVELTGRQKLNLARKRTPKLTKTYKQRNAMDIEDSEDMGGNSQGVPVVEEEFTMESVDPVGNESNVSVKKKKKFNAVRRTGRSAYHRRVEDRNREFEDDTPQERTMNSAYVQAWRAANPWATERDVNYVFKLNKQGPLDRIDRSALRQAAANGRLNYYNNEGVIPKPKVDNTELLKDAYQQITEMLNRYGGGDQLVNGKRGELGIWVDGKIVTNLKFLKKQLRGQDEYYSPAWDFYRSVLNMNKARRKMLRFKRRGYDVRKMRLISHRNAAKRQVLIGQRLKNQEYYNHRVSRLERQLEGIQKGAQALSQRVYNQREALDQLASVS